MKLGTGEHTYEWVEGWAKIPDDIQPGYTHGCVTDRNDNLYIFNQSEHAMLVFSPDGKLVSTWGSRYAKGAHGLLHHVEDHVEYLWLVDYELGEAVKCTLDGEAKLTVTRPPRDDIYAKPDDYRPTDIAIAPDGTIYITDGYGKPYVHQFALDGRYESSFGGPGDGEGQLKCPHGISVDQRGDEPVLYVADRGNSRVQVFDLDGKFIRMFDHEMRQPCGFDQHGSLLLVPDLQARVTLFDGDDQLVTHLGDGAPIWETKGWPNIPHEMRKVGVFSSPHYGCFDSKGSIYMAEWVSDGRITKLAKV